MPVNPKGVRTQKTQANNLKRAVHRMRLSYPRISLIAQSAAVMDLPPRLRVQHGRRCQMHTAKIPLNVRLTGIGAEKYRCKKVAVYHYESVCGGGKDVCGNHIYDALAVTREDQEAMLKWEYRNQDLFALIAKEEGVVDTKGGSGDTTEP